MKSAAPWDVRRECDFAVLTVQDRELAAVLALTERPTEDHSVEGELIFNISIPVASVSSAQAALSGVVMPVGGIGRVQAALTASQLLQRMTPRWLFLVGVAGGFHANGIRLGDIIVASQIYDYEVQRLTDEDSEVRMKVFEADQVLLAAGRAANRRGRSESILGPSDATVHFGPVLSGDKVIASEKVAATFLEKVPGLIGVEMEGAGVAAAVSRRGGGVRFLMIRGVVDLANSHKRYDSSTWRDRACDSAAAFTLMTAVQAHVIESS